MFLLRLKYIVILEHLTIVIQWFHAMGTIYRYQPMLYLICIHIEPVMYVLIPSWSSQQTLDIVFIKIKIKTYRSIGMFYIAFSMYYIIYYQMGLHIPCNQPYTIEWKWNVFSSTFEQFIAINTETNREKKIFFLFYKTTQQQTRKLSVKIFVLIR